MTTKDIIATIADSLEISQVAAAELLSKDHRIVLSDDAQHGLKNFRTSLKAIS